MAYRADSDFATILGSSISAADISSLSSIGKKYVDNFRTYADQHWAADGSDWSSANYYDRAKIYYEWYASTGNAEYLKRANALALDYRKDYLEANNYGASAHWAQMGGIALHYTVTGDPQSLKAVGAVADQFALPYYTANLGNTSPGTEMDGRVQSRVLESFLYAWKLDAPSGANAAGGIPGGNDWAKLLRSSLDSILKSQSADGAYHFQSAAQNGFHKPFMTGLLNDALIKYYEMFDPDPRIVTAIKKSLDYMWNKNWDPEAKAFVYLDGYIDADNSPIPAPDLNNLIVSGFGFVHSVTGDATYKTRGDAVFAGGVEGGWLPGSKQFNEAYTSSYQYLAYTNPDVPSLWTGSADPVVPPTQPAPQPLPEVPADDGADSGTDDDTGGPANSPAPAPSDKAGDDVIVGGSKPGNDTWDGGVGMDTVDYSSAIKALNANLLKGLVVGGSDVGTDKLLNIESVIGGSANDIITGNAVANELRGGAGLDTIRGGAGDDSLFGGRTKADSSDAGDTLYGQAGNDTVDGGNGDDKIFGGLDSDTVYAGLGADLIIGGNSKSDSADKADTLHGNEGNDTVYGNGGNDTVYGGQGADVVYGGQGNDLIFGGLKADDSADAADVIHGESGNDVIHANGGADTVNGGAGNDTIFGGAGSDYLTGGGGADTFVFVKGEAGGDRIGDFSGRSGQGDILKLAGYSDAATFTQIDSTHWKIVDGASSEIITISNKAFLTEKDYFFV